MRGGPGSEESIDPNETPEERERREKDRRAANNARERYVMAREYDTYDNNVTFHFLVYE
jgi:hypothetical protein